MLTYLIVVLAVRLTLVGGRLVLAPGAERFRLLPMSSATARYWLVWSAVLVGAFYFAKGTFRLVPVLGATLAARTLVGIVVSIILLGLALVALWRRPTLDGHRAAQRAYEGGTWLVSAYLVGVWLTAFTGETAPFDIGLILLLVILASFGLRSMSNTCCDHRERRLTRRHGRLPSWPSIAAYASHCSSEARSLWRTSSTST